MHALLGDKDICIGLNLLDTPEATRQPEKTEGRTDHS
jgi:hypothetical protein